MMKDRVFPKVDLVSRSLGSRDEFIRQLFDRPDSFARILPFEEFLESHGVFILKDGSLGAVFRVELLEHEPMSAEAIVEKVESLRSWFNLPERCCLQVLFDQSYIARHDPVWEKAKTSFPQSHPVSDLLFSKRLEMMRASCEGQGEQAPMRRETLISIRYFPEKIGSVRLKTLVERGERLLLSEVSEVSRSLSDFSHLLAQFEMSSKIAMKRITGAELVEHLRRFFNPKEYYKRTFASFNPSISISDQVVFCGPTGSLSGFEREGMKTRTITVKTNPRRVYPGGLASFTGLDFPVRLSLNFSFPTRAKAKSYFDMKEFFLQNTPSATARRQLHELKEIQERLAHDERCLMMTFCVIVEGESDEILDRRTRAVTSIFHNDLECEVIVEDLIGLGLCLNSLPLFYLPAADYSTQRAIRILNKDAVSLLPVFDSFRGLKNPLQIFLSREKGLVPFSLLENETSNHTVILGDTGSGKSAFALDCIQAVKRQSPEPLVFIIDKKASCDMLCRYFDGQLTVFDAGGEMPFSAFRGTFDDAKIQFLTTLILAAVKLTSASFEMESRHLTIVSRSVKEAYLRRAREVGVSFHDGELVRADTGEEISVSMDDVIAAMSSLTAEPDFESMKDEIDDLIARLMPFYGDGLYAPFFKGGASGERKSRALLYAYDLEALDGNETLKVLMSMSVIHEIMSIMGQPENVGRGGILAIEELGCLGRDNPIVGKYVVEAAERMRKLGFYMIGIAPRPENFFETEAGKAIWGAADNYVFLKMSSDNVDFLTKRSSLISDAAAEIMKSLETKKDQFAEVFYTNKAGTRQGAFRYIQSPYDRWLAPTNHKDQLRVKKAFQKFKGDHWKALESLVSEET